MFDETSCQKDCRECSSPCEYSENATVTIDLDDGGTLEC